MVRKIYGLIVGENKWPATPVIEPNDDMKEAKELNRALAEYQPDPKRATQWLEAELEFAPGREELRKAFMKIAAQVIADPVKFPYSSDDSLREENAAKRRFLEADHLHDRAKELAKVYARFIQALPSVQEAQDGIAFQVVDTELSDAQLRALFNLATGAPDDELSAAIRSINLKEMRDYIGWNKACDGDREAMLGIINRTRFKHLIPHLSGGTVSIPPTSRLAGGTFILGPPGSGKTTLIQYLAMQDQKEGALFVVDSQGALIPQLATVSDLGDRTILVEPGSVGINPFTIKGELGVDLITYLLGVLGGSGSELTSRQRSFFRPCLRLMLEVPDATFIDLHNLTQKGGLEPYRSYLPKLSQAMQSFFENEFKTSDAVKIKEELSWRLRPIVEDPVYERMFCSPETTLDLASAFEERKIVLIDTDKQRLGRERSALFGSIFIAFLYRAAMQREADTGELVYAYIDEFHEYLNDDQIADMLDELRKRRIAVAFATQRLDKIKSGNMRSAVLSAAVKFIRPGNDSDAHTLAREMQTTPEALLRVPKRSFALWVRDFSKGAPTVSVPEFRIRDDFDHVPIAEVRERMKQYAPSAPKPRQEPEPDEPEEESMRPQDDTKPTEW